MQGDSATATVPGFSVVVPVRNEAAAIPGLAAEIAAACAAAGLAWEAVWVDDGSSDGSRALLAALPAPHRLIALVRGCGQSAALMAGVRHARGEWVGLLDGDGQNDPADLPRQLAHAHAGGWDLVNGIRARRRDSWPRRLASVIANRVRDAVTGDRVTDVGCATRVVRRAALRQLPLFDGLHRYLPTLVRAQGFRVAEIPVGHRPRQGGLSKYGINDRLWRGLRDLLGVRWLLARRCVWQVEQDEGAPTAGALEAPPAPVVR